MNIALRTDSWNVSQITVDELKKKRLRIGCAIGYRLVREGSPGNATSILNAIVLGVELIDVMLAWASTSDHSRITDAGLELCRAIQADMGDALVQAFGKACPAGGSAMALPMVRNAWLDVARVVVATLETSLVEA